MKRRRGLCERWGSLRPAEGARGKERPGGAREKTPNKLHFDGK